MPSAPWHAAHTANVASPLTKSGFAALATGGAAWAVGAEEANAGAAASDAMANKGEATAVTAISKCAINFMVLL